MEIIIGNKKYMLKENISGREEHLSGIFKFIGKLSADKKDIMNLFFNEEFNEVSLNLLSYMLIEPKMTPNKLLDLNSADLLSLKLESLLLYANSLEGIQEYMEKKKIMTLKDSQMDSSICSETKPIRHCNGLE